MRKTVLALVFLILCASLFAAGATEDGPYTGVTDNAFRPTTVNVSDRLNYSLFVNASGLAKGGLAVELPYLESSSYNIAGAVKDRSVAEALSRITKFQADRNDWIVYVLGLVMASGTGYSDVFTSDIGTGAIIGNFSFGFNLKAGIQAMPPIVDGETGQASSPAGNGYVPQVNYAFSFAYGRRIVDTDRLTLDIGGAVRFAEKVYLHQLTLSVLTSVLWNPEGINYLPARGGFAVPLDLGVTLGILDGMLEFSAMADNLNGVYYMKDYANYKDALLFRDGNNDDENMPALVYTPFSLSLAAKFNPRWDYVDPTVYLEFTGINRYLETVSDRQYGFLEMLRYIDAGLNLNLFSLFDLRANYRYGYPEFGVAFDAFGNMVELSYGFKEAGEEYGLKPVDHLTVRMRLGYSR